MDALLVLSFGGPEKPEDVMQFLENVTRGRGIPPERLVEVGEHYYHFGGRSPINELNLALIEAVKAELKRNGLELPVYFGNRNWHPMVEDTVATMTADGVQSALVFATSAWSGYSGCLQYQEDIKRARAAVDGAPHLMKLRQFYDHPLYIAAMAHAIAEAREELPAELREEARLIFTAHSVPNAADAAAGPSDAGGHLYSRQVAEASRLAAAAAAYPDFDLVWQSRSGPPQVPWLEPDVVDHVSALADAGARAVIVCPIGFISDHMEVVWDLDNELRDMCVERGVALARVATAGTDPRFAQMIVELVQEHIGGVPARRLGAEPSFGCTVDGAPCAVGCCAIRRG
ncbi:ferrochelatase [Smaragdicoccus niigatensis]|uniref:ferrochelatase n=1 Tax=Smaragdicoccus niigatensis TaxID=359359 RepID=UPI0003648693|nr:ferrochelatase [Smaragdicoccus niigatensis]